MRTNKPPDLLGDMSTGEWSPEAMAARKARSAAYKLGPEVGEAAAAAADRIPATSGPSAAHEQDDRLSYRDYLVWTAAHTAAMLNEAIRVAMDMREEYAVEHLEKKLDAVNAVANYSNPNPERVKPRGR